VCKGTEPNLLVCPFASKIVQGDGNRRYMIALDTTVDIFDCLKEEKTINIVFIFGMLQLTAVQHFQYLQE